MKLRDALKQAVRDLLAQGFFGANPGGGCAYLTPAGYSCVVGLLLKEQAPDVQLASLFGPVSVAMMACPTIRTALEKLEGQPVQFSLDALLMDMQGIHDNAASIQREEGGSMERAILAAMGAYRLSYGAGAEAAAIYKEVLNEQPD